MEFGQEKSVLDQRDDSDAQSIDNPLTAEQCVLFTKISREDVMDCDRSLSIPRRLTSRISNISVRSLPNPSSHSRYKKRLPSPDLKMTLPLEEKRVLNQASAPDSPRTENQQGLLNVHDCQSTVSAPSKTERTVNEVISRIKIIRSKLESSKDSIIRLEEKSNSILKDDCSVSSTRSPKYKESKISKSSADHVLQPTKSEGSKDEELALKSVCDNWDSLSQTEVTRVATNQETCVLSTSSQTSKSMKEILAKYSSSSMKGTSSVILREAHKLSLAIAGTESFKDSDSQGTGGKSEPGLVRSLKMVPSDDTQFKRSKETRKDNPCLEESKKPSLQPMQPTKELVSRDHKLSRDKSNVSADASFLDSPVASYKATEHTDIQSTSPWDSRDRKQESLTSQELGKGGSLARTPSTKTMNSAHLPLEIKHSSSKQSRVSQTPSLNSKTSRKSGKTSTKSRTSHYSLATSKSTVCQVQSVASNKSRCNEVCNGSATLKAISKDTSQTNSKSSEPKSENGQLCNLSKHSTSIQSSSFNEISDGRGCPDPSVNSPTCESQIMAEKIPMARSNRSSPKDASMKSPDLVQHTIPSIRGRASEKSTALEYQNKNLMDSGESSAAISACLLKAESNERLTSKQLLAKYHSTNSVEHRTKPDGGENEFVSKETKNADSIICQNKNAVVPQRPAYGSTAENYSTKLLRRTKSLPVVTLFSKHPLAMVEENKACMYDGTVTSFCFDSGKVGTISSIEQEEHNEQLQQNLSDERDVHDSVSPKNKKIEGSNHGKQTEKKKKKKRFWRKKDQSLPCDSVSYDGDYATKYHDQVEPLETTKRLSRSRIGSPHADELDIGKEYKAQADKLLFHWNYKLLSGKGMKKRLIHNPFIPRRLDESDKPIFKEVGALEMKQISTDQLQNGESDRFETVAKETKSIKSLSMMNDFSQIPSTGITKIQSSNSHDVPQKRNGKKKGTTKKKIWNLRQKALVASDSSELAERSLLDGTSEFNSNDLKLHEDSHVWHVIGKRKLHKLATFNNGKSRKVENEAQISMNDRKIRLPFQSKTSKYDKNLDEKCAKESATLDQSGKDVVAGTFRFINAKNKIRKVLQRSQGSSPEKTHEETGSKTAILSTSNENHDVLQEHLHSMFVVRCDKLDEVEVFEKGYVKEEDVLFLDSKPSKELTCQMESPQEKEEKCHDTLGTESVCKSKHGFIVTRDDATHTNTTISSLTARSAQDLVTRLVKIQSQLKKSKKSGTLADRARVLRENAMLVPGKGKQDESQVTSSIFCQHVNDEPPFGSSKTEEKFARHERERPDRSYYSGYTGDHSSDIIRIVHSDSSTAASSSSGSQFKVLDIFNCACG